jgi:hypothetical protein
MGFRKPSPAMVVAVVALVTSGTGSAIAAVNYAKRAGAVDGKSAVKATASLSRAAGKLVATRRTGENKGKIPNKFLGQVPEATTFGRYAEVIDNAAGGDVALNASRLGTLSAACNDQAGASGNEDPTSTVSYTNTTTVAVNVARSVGNQQAVVVSVPAGARESFTINGSNTFRIHAEIGGVDVVYEGQVRQDGRGTAAGSCLVAGTVETITP